MTPPDPLLPSPAQRLEQSRERMRQCLTPPDDTKQEASLGQAFRQHPLLSSIIVALEGWWESHPWRPATFVAGGLVREALVPLARKHPIGLVVAAMMLGGSLVWFRPARGLVKGLLIKGMVSQSLMGLMQQPFIGNLANTFITWMQQIGHPDKPRPPP
jgi:hypothetical protein